MAKHGPKRDLSKLDEREDRSSRVSWSPVVGNNGIKDGRQLVDTLTALRELSKWEPVDPADEDAIEERVDEYFAYCIERGVKPTVESLAMSIGVTRHAIFRWVNGREGSTKRKREIMERAKEMISALLTTMTMDGKVHPTAWIFWMKNNAGYVDKQEHVITPNNPLGEVKDENELRKKLEERIVEED